MELNKPIVISRAPNGGIGDHLLCLLGSLWYAKQTNRILIVDWRGSRFNSNRGHNCFFDFFEPVTEILGVPVIGDDTVKEITTESPYYWDKWTTELLQDYQHAPHTTEEIEALQNLVLSGEQRPESTVVFNQYFYLPRKLVDLSSITTEINFSRHIQERADEFCNLLNTDSDDLIAIHIRHGNGENIGSRSAYWLDFIDFCRQSYMNYRNDMHSTEVHGRFFDNMPKSLMAEKKNTRAERRLYNLVKKHVDELRSQSGQQSPVILFTDATQVVEGLSSHIEGLYRFDTELLEPGSGPMHNFKEQDGNNIDSSEMQKRTDDMLTELEVMRRCSSLIYIESGFSTLLQIKLAANKLFELKPPFLNRLLLKVFG